jgi:hypothetical protein
LAGTILIEVIALVRFRSTGYSLPIARLNSADGPSTRGQEQTWISPQKRDLT